MLKVLIKQLELKTMYWQEWDITKERINSMQQNQSEKGREEPKLHSCLNNVSLNHMNLLIEDLFSFSEISNSFK
jgi:hypothetical protein